MRTVILSFSAAALLAIGVAFSVQATRPPSRPIEAAQDLPEAPVAAAPQVVGVAPTPMTFRQVRSVSVAEPKPMTERSAQAAAEKDRIRQIVIPEAEGHVATTAAAAPVLDVPVTAKSAEAAVRSPSTQQAAPVERQTKTALAGKRYVSHSRKNARRQPATKEDAPPSLPPAALAYDGSHEEHTPLYSLRKIFRGAQ
jgi:hypothetical protein